MTSITLTFAGTEQDAYGMPNPYHHYYIAASDDIPNTGYATATICPVVRAPLPTNGSHVVCKGKAQAAIEKAIEDLASLPENAALQQFRGLIFKSPPGTQI